MFCVIKNGNKYLSHDDFGYKWVTTLGCAYLYYGDHKVVKDFHSYIMSREDDSEYKTFIAKSIVQVVEVLFEEKI